MIHVNDVIGEAVERLSGREQAAELCQGVGEAEEGSGAPLRTHPL